MTTNDGNNGSEHVDPTFKAPAIDQFLFDTFDVDRVETIRAMKCAWEKGFDRDDQEHSVEFTDESSRREYGISGLCQTCQDSFFGAGGDDADDYDESKYYDEPLTPEQEEELDDDRNGNIVRGYN